ncbi:MAG TPA: NmrA family NAD(P)-binding protein [Thermoguttaceae bacterium]|nr:NmrA family NAD(P)-binding protein [Thermoguttaceae bacterium]
MRIAITTPSGHIGGAVTHYALEAGAEVRLMGRRPEKLKQFADRGAKVVRGSQDDMDFVKWMTYDVDALFWVTPPGYGSDDLRAFQNRLGRVAACAIRENHIPRVVNISAIGAHLDSGVGPVNGLHDVEHLLDAEAYNILHLRPGFFFENFLWQIAEIRARRRICMPVSPSCHYPMLATRDIARVAADWLLDTRWAGRCVQELHGPADLTFEGAARAISEGLGHTISYMKLDRPQARASLIQGGMSENAADLILELYDAMETGRLKPNEPRSPQTTTSTTLVEFAQEVIAPMLAERVTH